MALISPANFLIDDGFETYIYQILPRRVYPCRVLPVVRISWATYFYLYGVSLMNKVLKTIGLFLAPVGVVLAAVPAEVTTSIAAAGTDSVTVAGAVLAVIVGIFAIKLMRKAL